MGHPHAVLTREPPPMTRRSLWMVIAREIFGMLGIGSPENLLRYFRIFKRPFTFGLYTPIAWSGSEPAHSPICLQS